MSDWSPHHYLKFAGERSRPALDLLSHVDVTNPSVIYDLGCGPGNSTALLLQRYPEASVTGVDNSPAMLASARLATPAAHYLQADLSTWQPPGQVDVLFANAALQWVDDHVALMQRLLAGLKPGGCLAVQMPDNLEEPSHVLMRKVAGDARWVEQLRHAASARQPILPARQYANQLLPLCRSLDIWRTSYHHRLESAAAIVDFVSSTGLRPFLDPLDDAGRKAFKAAYEQEIRLAYPPLNDGTVLLAFPRLFIVAYV